MVPIESAIHLLAVKNADLDVGSRPGRLLVDLAAVKETFQYVRPLTVHVNGERWPGLKFSEQHDRVPDPSAVPLIRSAVQMM